MDWISLVGSGRGLGCLFLTLVVYFFFLGVGFENDTLRFIDAAEFLM